MSLENDFYPESRFGGYTRVDGTMAFYTRAHALMDPTSVVLDFGCGRGAYGEDPVSIRRDLRILRGKAGRVIGLDVDEAARANPYIDEFHLIRADPWPLADNSVDLCICDSVLEHLEDPASFFSEARRVLKTGGHLCIRTPNAWSYIALISKLVPQKYHAGVLKIAQEGREEEDIFPTYYRCNSIRKLRAMLRKQGFEGVVYGYDAEPSYLCFSRLAYRLGVFYQRHCPGFLGAALLCFARPSSL